MKWRYEMKKQYTSDQRRAYFKKLRDSWQNAKNHAEDHKAEFEAIMINHGLNFSLTAYAFVLQQMQEQGLEGIPYLDVKTYAGWKESGFKVKKGERSILSSIVWLKNEKKGENEEESNYTFPKATALFHKNQTEMIGV